MKDVIAFLVHLDAVQFITTLWFLLFVEVPRFLISSVAVGLSEYDRSTAWRSAGETRRALKLSVIVPCHNGATGIVKTVMSLREQTLSDLQIVAVDDGSTDNTREVGRHLESVGLIDVFLSTRLRGGKSSALNLGLEYCTGDLVVSADADTTFDRDSLAKVRDAFAADPALGAAGGNIAVRNARESFLTAMQAVEYAVGISLGRRVSGVLGVLPIVSGAYAAFRRTALTGIGGWEAGPGEDADVTLKIRRAGWRIGFVPQAWALTDTPASCLALIRQRFRWDTDLARIYGQKFSCLVKPWEPRFSWTDTLTTLDVIVFSIAAPLAFVVYLIWVFASFGSVAIALLGCVFMYYAIQGVLLFGISLIVVERRGRVWLLPYALGYGAYNVCFLFPLRGCAIIDELVSGRSYRSDFVPKKVMKRIPRF